MIRQKQGLKARRVKGMFEFIDDYLEQESKRIADYNKKGHITAETFRVKKHHMDLLKNSIMIKVSSKKTPITTNFMNILN